MGLSSGGRWIFCSTFGPIGLGINNGVAPVFPTPQADAFNIEVFTSATVAGLPTPDSGFQTSIADANGTLDNGFLTGTDLRLGSGDFLVVDVATGSSTQGPSKITLGSGSQTVIGARGDTLVGGQSAGASQIISALAGSETVIGGAPNNASIWGGAGDSIVSGTGANQQIVLTGMGATVQLGATGGNVTSRPSRRIPSGNSTEANRTSSSRPERTIWSTLASTAEQPP